MTRTAPPGPENAPSGGPKHTRTRTRRRRVGLAAGTVATVLLVAAAGWGIARNIGTADGDTGLDATAAATQFLDRYVDPDGRVVRVDEGGDTVSEGQAYGLLVAVAIGDEPRFRAIWTWTRFHLARTDGVLSWRWVPAPGTPSGGAVADANSAADADLDAARALLLAGDRFADPALADDGRRLAAAVLATETAAVGTALLPVGSPAPAPGSAVAGTGRVLTGGTWADSAPFLINPSYFNPRADELLGRTTADPRWDELTRTQRTLSWQLIGAGRLPPDWAAVDLAGVATPASTPGAGRVPGFGLDAARFPVRMAESCDGEDRALAAALLPLLDRPDGDVVGVNDLVGRPAVSWTNPVALVAVAAAARAAGDHGRADTALDAATNLDRRVPTYYGAAWVALGRIMLDTTLLETCPD